MIELFMMPFMQRAFIAGILVGFLASFYGVFIVQRRMSFLGSGLSHAAFGGVALGVLLDTEPLWIAIPFTVLVSAAITWIKNKTRLGADTSIGIFFSVSVALGIIFLSMKDGYTSDAFAYLFGSILAVNNTDNIVAVLLAIITLLFGKIYWARWAYTTFDRELALTDKISVEKDDYILSALTAVSIVVSVKLVGIILISSFLVIPAAAARLVSGTFFQMARNAIIAGISSAFLGLTASYYLDFPSGAVIVLIQALMFLIAFILKKDN